MVLTLHFKKFTMISRFFYTIIFILLTNSLFAQKFTISGSIKDAENGEMLIGALVSVPEMVNVGTTANVYGFYSLTIPQGKHTIKFSFIGYEPILKIIDLKESTKIDVELSSKQTQLNEVVIKSEKDDKNIKSMEMSVQKLDIKQINKIPALLGEIDVIRTIQLLPGVSTVGEGASGFNVRGGGTDQNLVLLDDAPVFNSSHLFGFFSVFNPDAVKDVKLVKGGIPAQYGGRLSSLLDVRMKDGNSKRFAGSAGIGTIFSRLAIEGPIVKNKGSFIIAGRRSYFDQFFKLSPNPTIKNAIAYFYDFTAKANYTLSSKDRIYLSGYLGRDKFKFGGRNGFGFDWGNATATLRYNHVFNQKLFSAVSLIYSNYDYSLGVGTDTSGFEWNSKIINYAFKPEFTYYLNSKNTITFGINSTYYTFDPGLFTFKNGTDNRSFGGEKKYALENAIYIANEQMITGRLSAQYGLRYSYFINVGPGTVYDYKDTVGNFARPTIGSTKYTKGQIQNTYQNFEPRLSLKFELSESSSLKASYNRMAQYIHLISNTTANTPLDVWTPSNKNVKPQLADQFTVGYFKNFKDNDYETSVEVYYKDLKNQIDYVDGANLLLNEKLEGELVNGIGRAYGAEFYIRKTSGKLTGWISYTLSKTERKSPNISNDLWYNARFDKRHNLTVVATYDFNKLFSIKGAATSTTTSLVPINPSSAARFNLGFNFVFTSGTPATFPTARYTVQGLPIPHNAINSRNNVTIPPYHRMDLSLTYNFKERKNINGNVVFSVYNLYGRRNPFSIYFQRDPASLFDTQAVQFSVIARPIPAVTLNLTF